MNTSSQKIAIVDATGADKGRRRFTRDAIGCGPRSIAGVVEQLGIDSKIFLAEEILSKGFTEEFDLLFISAMSMDKIAVEKLVKFWRKNFHGKIVLGGPITSEPEQILKSTKVDIIVVGEGEITVKELISSNAFNVNTKLENILGIGYIHSDGNIKINNFRQYSSREQFRSFQASTSRILDYPNHFSAKIYVECVRGCSNFGGTKIELPDGRKCSNCGFCESNCLDERLSCPDGIPPGCGFCSVPNLFGPARSRSVKQVVSEINELLNHNVKRIILSAPDFLDFGRDEYNSKPLIHPTIPAANSEKIEELLTSINSLKQVSKSKAWIEVENIKAQLFSEKIAKIIAKYLPNSSFSIGCETGSEEHAKLLGRSSKPNDTLEAVKIAHKLGLKAHVYFIHSLPGQTKQTAQETVNLIYRLEPYIEKITIYRFRPLPMTAFGDYPLPQPAIKNPVSKLIADAANEVNLRKKKNLIGETVKVIIGEPNYHDKKGAIAYILSGGPMVAVENARDKMGEILKVEILRAISEKLVFGKIIE
ncbi:MAG TPA: radical SAM protein [candidate division Zixibacteria bacterium]|nr:radical SAM protein [candidate division Zixibacteria bacterium]